MARMKKGAPIGVEDFCYTPIRVGDTLINKHTGLRANVNSYGTVIDRVTGEKIKKFDPYDWAIHEPAKVCPMGTTEEDSPAETVPAEPEIVPAEPEIVPAEPEIVPEEPEIVPAESEIASADKQVDTDEALMNCILEQAGKMLDDFADVELKRELEQRGWTVKATKVVTIEL